MFDLPLHPVVVHFPIVLGILLPFVGFLTWWGIKKEIVPQKVWLVVIALALVFTISSMVAVGLGEKDEEKFEKFVADHPDRANDLKSLYTIVRRDKQGQLKTIADHDYFKKQVTAAADKVREAASLANDPGLKKYLYMRADALLDDDFQA